MAGALHAQVKATTWALSAMSLGLAAALLTAGALADDFGRRRVLRASSAVLAAATVLAAVAPSIGVFVAARILQGMAGAGALAAGLGLIGHAFTDGAQRTKATGIWGATVGGGIAIGPLLAALLAIPGDWRTAYWLQALLAVGLWRAARDIPESRAAVAQRVDAAGALTLGASMTAITAGFVNGRTDWTATLTLAMFAVGLALLAVFIAVERLKRAPMLDLGLFRRPAFVAAMLGAFVNGMSLIGLMSYMATFDQTAVGLTLLASATLTAVWAGTSTLTAWHARRLPEALAAEHRMSIGFAIAAAGLLGVSFLPLDVTWERLLPGLLVSGVGAGLVNAALGRLAVASVPADKPGVGSGATNTARYLGGAAGVALSIAIATGSGTDVHGLVHGWNTAAVVAAVLAALGAVVIALLREGQLETRAAAATPPPGALRLPSR
jgi:MFS family permease